MVKSTRFVTSTEFSNKLFTESKEGLITYIKIVLDNQTINFYDAIIKQSNMLPNNHRNVITNLASL